MTTTFPMPCFKYEWIPTNIDGCVLWLRSDLAWQDAEKTVPCTDTTYIYTAEDKTLLGRDLVCPFPLWGKPQFLSNQVGVYPAWRFLAASQTNLKAAAFTWNNPADIYLVFTPRVWSAGMYIFDGNITNANVFAQQWNPGAEPSYSTYPTIEYASTHIECPTNTPSIVRLTLNGSTTTLRVNNSASVNYTALGTPNPGGFCLGGGGGADGQWTTFDFIELFGYSAVLTSPQDISAMSYLNTRYAIY